MFRNALFIVSSSFLDIPHLHYALLLCNLGLSLSIYHKVKITFSVLGLCLKAKSLGLCVCRNIGSASDLLSTGDRIWCLSGHSRCEWQRPKVECFQVLTAGLSTEVAFEVCGCHDYCHHQIWEHHCFKPVKWFIKKLIIRDWNMDYSKQPWHERMWHFHCDANFIWIESISLNILQFSF